MQGMVKIMRRPGCLTSNAHPLSGPSSAFSYAVGIVPHILQLQAKDWGFHLETWGFHSAGFHTGQGFHGATGFHFRALILSDLRDGATQTRTSLNGAL